MKSFFIKLIPQRSKIDVQQLSFTLRAICFAVHAQIVHV